MKNWQDLIIPNTFVIREAMKKIDDLGGKGLYVTDDKQSAVGSITDGDIRRALLSGVGLQENVTLAMVKDFVFIKEELSLLERREILKSFKVQSAPVLNQNMEIVDVIGQDFLTDHSDYHVVLLAGGMGTRLGKLTENLPKPMIPVAGKPILERIIQRFLDQGFSQFHLSVNYKSEMIEDYFLDGSALGCNIAYLKETKRLGTAGPLSLLPENMDKPVVVMNADLLTHVNLGQLLKFHQGHNAKITISVRDYEVQVPFGVISIENGYATSFLEKPVYNFNVNAGIYIIEPEILKIIPKDEYYDMNSLLETMLAQNKEIACYPIVEGWIDVGRESDLLHAHEIYSKRSE